MNIESSPQSLDRAASAHRRRLAGMLVLQPQSISRQRGFRRVAKCPHSPSSILFCLDPTVVRQAERSCQTVTPVPFTRNPSSRRLTYSIQSSATELVHLLSPPPPQPCASFSLACLTVRTTNPYSIYSSDAAGREPANVNPEDEIENYHGPCSDIVNRATAKVDVFVRCERSICLLRPLMPRATEWICENLQPDAQVVRPCVVEHGMQRICLRGCAKLG